MWPQAVPKGSKTVDRMTRLDAKHVRAKSDLALLIALGRMVGWKDDSESGENGLGLH